MAVMLGVIIWLSNRTPSTIGGDIQHERDSIDNADEAQIAEPTPIIDNIVTVDTNKNSVSSQNTGSASRHEYVDLGLPSGTLWATTNIGAANPWDYGDYFAWGETTTKSKYDWSTLKYCEDNTGDKFSKYNTQSEFGSVDNKSTLERTDDAAAANWGSDWCMPTLDQIQELEGKCKWVWTTDHGVNGYKVTGPNGNSLFLPAAGCRYGTDHGDVGSEGDYWSCLLHEPYPGGACCLLFSSSGVVWTVVSRDGGHTVRPVRCR